jgi:predicted O-methyltransferase YrrM
MNLLEFAAKVGVNGYLHPAEMEMLAELGANCDCVEVGSFRGLSAYAIALGAKSLLCVDTFRADEGGQTQQAEPTTLEDFKRATGRFANVRYLVMTSAEAAQLVNDTFDLIFIDAMHDYENVKQDTAHWYAKLRPGGVISWHDYQDGFPGVQRAVNEFGGADGVTHTLAWKKKPA